MKLYEFENKQSTSKAIRLNESIKLCKAVTALLEAEGDLEFHADPAYAGVKGINRDSGAGNQAAAAAEKKSKQAKVNATWQKMLRDAKSQGPDGRAKMMPFLKKLVAAAQKGGFELDPSPKTSFGLGEGRFEDEGADFYDGQQVELKPKYADSPGEVFTLSNWDGRKGWIGDAQGRGWGVRGHQIQPVESYDDEDDDESPWGEEDKAKWPGVKFD